MKNAMIIHEAANIICAILSASGLTDKEVATERRYVAFARDPAEEQLIISGESAYSGLFCDYYGEYEAGFPFIHPDLEAWADKNDLTLEWENAGCVRIYPN